MMMDAVDWMQEEGSAVKDGGVMRGVEVGEAGGHHLRLSSVALTCASDMCRCC